MTDTPRHTETPTPPPNDQRVEKAVDTPSPYIPVAVAAISLGGIYLAHLFSKRRESITRHAAACSKFRAAVLSAVSGIPAATVHWDNQILSSLPTMCTTIGLAVDEFRPFVTGDRLAGLDNEWDALKQHCEDQIPKALSAAELMYGGGSPVAKSAKEQLHAHVKNLLSLAKET